MVQVGSFMMFILLRQHSISTGRRETLAEVLRRPAGGPGTLGLTTMHHGWTVGSAHAPMQNAAFVLRPERVSVEKNQRLCCNQRWLMVHGEDGGDRSPMVPLHCLMYQFSTLVRGAPRHPNPCTRPAWVLFMSRQTSWQVLFYAVSSWHVLTLSEPGLKSLKFSPVSILLQTIK